jgi:hypothetical protein
MSSASHSTLHAEDFLLPSRLHDSAHLSTRQYARIVNDWVRDVGLDPAGYGSHTMRSMCVAHLPLLLGHTKLESTVRYLGIEVDDVLELGEQTEG